MITDVEYSESRSEEHPEHVSSVLLADERVGVRVDVSHRLGIRNHKVLCLRNLVRKDDKSQSKVMHPEEAINFKRLPIFLLPSDVGFTGFLQVNFREVSKECVALPRTWDV
jgi:hypothetical protein